MVSITDHKSDILVVDDKPDNLRLIGGMLKERNYGVRLAPSGSLALKAAESKTPDIVLMDIVMPEMDGYETCRELKKREDLRAIPIIFLSALGETIDKVKAFSCGGVDYITKPFKIEEVEARINTHVTIRRLRESLQEHCDELEKLEQLRDNLMHMVIHDLRSPLGVVVNTFDFLGRDSKSQLSENSSQLVGLASSQTDLILRMVSDMLDISRMEAGELPVKLKDEDLVSIMEDASSNVAICGQHLILEEPLDGIRPVVRCDRDLVRRVLANFLGNAAKFTPPGKEVRMSIRSENEPIRLEVRDNGPGIAPEYHERIFEKFGQVDASQRKSMPATGMGLTFCRLAIEAHGGSVGVDSELGNGATFWFTLPKH